MNDRRKKKQDQLGDLARRFRDSANTLRHVAHRINAAAHDHDETLRRLDRVGEQLGDGGHRAPEAHPRHFTYLEYLEFSSADEFRKFKDAEAIGDAEIADVDWDDLSERLLSA